MIFVLRPFFHLNLADDTTAMQEESSESAADPTVGPQRVALGGTSAKGRLHISLTVLCAAEVTVFDKHGQVFNA